MKTNNDFDWYEYYKLAKSFSDKYNIAKQRTGMSRFYYSSFLESRDFILENKIFLSPVNEKNMKSKSGKVHQETRFTFKKHKQLNKNNIGAKIAQRLNVLRKYRNLADYDSKNPKNLKHAYNRCQRKARKIFELLDELK